jgi:alpha-galactosidase
MLASMVGTASAGPTRVLRLIRGAGAALVVLGLSPSTSSPHLQAAASIDVGDAYVRQSADGWSWEIGTSGIAYRVVMTKVGLWTEGLLRPGRSSVIRTDVPESEIGIGDQRYTIGTRAFQFLGAEAAAIDGRAVLTLGFRLRDRPVTVRRHVAATPGAPILELWTTVEADDATAIRDLHGLTFEFLDARDTWWHRGLEVGDGDGGPFTRQSARLAEGQHVEFGSPVLSSQEHLPWFGLTAGDQEIVAGLAWSGAWRASFDGTAAGVRLDTGLRGMSATAAPGRPVEGPHAFIGVTAADPGAVAQAVAAWIAGRRQGRPFPSFVTYNPWFAFGTFIDDALIRQQIDGFAGVGGELFELDAGWYPPIAATDRFDFTAGLGSWDVDASRFPQGLGALSDHAHARGLRFGVWVEPERVDLATVGRGRGASARFLATQQGQIQPGRPNAQAREGQICLADDEAWRWVRDRLFTFLDEARADYVKIDLNGFLVCTRDDHGHPSDGGNFAHTQGYYRLFAALRARYPALLIENVAGGARRLDAETLTLADAQWMDDRTTPAARVRHHYELLTAVAPASALLSYLMPHQDEPVTGAVDLPLLARSRMPGVLGLTVDFRSLTSDDLGALSRQIADYKQLRGLRGSPYSIALTAPVGVDGRGPAWDVVQQVNPATGGAVVHAYRNAGGARSVRVVLRQLRADGAYRIRTLEGGVIGTAGGADLMTRGLDIDASRGSASAVYVLEPQ